ncbi:hypothetical protein ACJRO7_036277, partial [Eucalyptus globulus]
FLEGTKEQKPKEQKNKIGTKAKLFSFVRAHRSSRRLKLRSSFSGVSPISPAAPTRLTLRRLLTPATPGISYEYKAVDLRKEKQYTAEFDKLNPMHLVPVLVDGDFVVSDSYAILLYLEEKYPQKALLPRDPRLKALNLQAASIISSSIQPLQMLTVLAKFPTLRRIHESYKTLPEYEASSPERQPDATI